MGDFPHRSSGLLLNYRADSQFLGLSRVHHNRLQVGSWTPARCPLLHAYGQSLLAVCQRCHTGSTHGEHHERTAQRGMHNVPLLDHYPPDTPTHTERLAIAHHWQAHCNRGIGPGGSAHLYFQRHLLVLGCRRRSVCLLLGLHGCGVLAHTQVGRQCRQASQRPLARAHSLHDGPQHRRTYA